MFVYGCIYIYKQGFTIRGKRFLVQLWPEGPTSRSKVFWTTQRTAHPVLFPTSRFYSEEVQCRKCFSGDVQTIIAPIWSVCRALCIQEFATEPNRYCLEGGAQACGQVPSISLPPFI
jgi:hypothetical protein